jgi:SAM-dependent methyltransferase
VLVAAFCSLRWGELAALRRADVDLAARTVKIERTLHHPADGGHSFGPPKSAAGHRTVIIPDLILDELASHLPRLPFANEQFDAVVANFVLNHVGRPLAALSELRRATRPGGRVAVTIWADPGGSGQKLIGRAVQAAGVTRPDDLPPLAPEDDFPRTAAGLSGLLAAAGMTDTSSQVIEWEHRVTAEDWWSGPAAGVSCAGHLIVRQTPEKIAEIKRYFDDFSGEFATPDGMLALPHAAVLATAAPEAHKTRTQGSIRQ